VAGDARITAAAPAADHGALGGSASAAVADADVAWAIFAVAVDLVGDLIVHRDVVHLRDWQPHAVPSLGSAARDGDRHTNVMADDEPIRIGRIDPHVMVVGA